MCWIEVFKTGDHIDSQGRGKSWSPEDLSRIADQYDPREHEAPLVLGHPQHDSPAYGWVEALKVTGQSLMAKLKAVDDDFRQWVNEGRYKKRSISLYPDLQLRHIGFLGGLPPAVKGLRDFTFPQEFFEGGLMEYEETLILEETVSSDQSKELEKQVIALRAEIDQLSQELLRQKQENERLTSQMKEEEASQKKAEVQGFVDEKVKEGKILPAWKQQGIAEFMLALEGDETSYEFQEGAAKPLGSWFRDFLEGLEPTGLFSTFAAPTAATLSPAERIGQEIAQASGAQLNQS